MFSNLNTIRIISHCPLLTTAVILPGYNSKPAVVFKHTLTVHRHKENFHNRHHSLMPTLLATITVFTSYYVHINTLI